jgi:hypothetical protein
LGFGISLLLFLFVALAAVSCTRVQVADAFKGTVVDADSGSPLPGAAVRVIVMRMSSYDGASQFQNYLYTADENGVFVMPARRKIVESIPNRIEEIYYYEVIQISKPGYEPRQFRTDSEGGLFSENAQRDKIVVRLKKIEPSPGP